MLIEKMNPKGHFKIFGRMPGQDWNLLVDKNNLIVTSGKQFIRDLLSGQDTTNYIKSFAFGTGDTTPALTDTDLESPVPYNGSDIYKTFEEYTNVSATSITFIGYFSSLMPVTQPVDLTEIGLFTGTGTTPGIMYCRATFDAITKTNALELRLEYSLEW